MFLRLPGVEVPIPTPDTTSVTDWQNWPREAWAFIAALFLLGVALFLWRNISDKIKFALVLVLGACTAVYFMS